MTRRAARRAARERGAVRAGLVIILVLLVLGVGVAAVGVTSAVTSAQDYNELNDYSDARDVGKSELTVGKAGVAAGQELCNCNAQTRDVVYQMLDAAIAGNADRYNQLREQFNQLADQHNALVTRLL